ncbi:MAG TPA: glycosyltransferase family 39 protein [Thermoanaerobaculia bacterium]|nr:glycosyltransferase family 39 protein [Thermoanaerobaculia bacterium]
MRHWLTFGAIVVTIITLVRIASTYSVFSETNDEPMHVSCGLQIYEQHQYDYQTANPPLPRLFIAAGPRMLGARLAPDMPFPGFQKTFYSAGNYPRTLIAARAGTLVFVLIALAAAWGWARREAGPLAAFLTVLLLAGEPLFLGHGGLATHDAAAAAGMAVSLFAFSRWLERPGRRAGDSSPSMRLGMTRAANAGLLGAAYGFAMLCKFSCVVFVPAAWAAILLVRALRRRAPRPREIGAMLVIVCLASAAVVWAGYGFSFGTLMPMGFVTEVISYPPLLSWHLPAPRFIDGLAMIRHFDREGMTSYLYGHLRTRGWWYYFPVAVALKTTLPLLALAILGLVVARRSPAAETLAAAAAILVVTFPSTLDIGVRYVLPLYVPLAFAGAVTATVMLERSRAWRAAAAVLIVAHVAVSALAHPDYVAYFNALAGHNPSRWLIDSNLEWGQDAKRLAEVARELRVDYLHNAVMSIADFDVLGFPPRNNVSPGDQTHGWLAVGEHFYRITKAELGGRLWLDGRPYRRVGKSIRLYHIP